MPPTPLSEAPPAPRSLYTDAAYYSMMFDTRQHDLEHYRELAVPTGEVLELGVGTGRVALPLARAGVRVIGIDSAAAMLAQLAQRAAAEPQSVQDCLFWQQGDLRSIRLSRRFGGVLYPFNGLAHHPREQDLAAVFDTVRHHLTPEGWFAFDVILPDPLTLSGSSATAPWFRHPATGEVCRYDETTSYDSQRRLLLCTATIRFLEVEREPEVLQWQLRQWFPDEIPPLLERHRFQLARDPVELADTTTYVVRPASNP